MKPNLRTLKNLQKLSSAELNHNIQPNTLLKQVVANGLFHEQSEMRCFTEREECSQREVA